MTCSPAWPSGGSTVRTRSLSRLAAVEPLGPSGTGPASRPAARPVTCRPSSLLPATASTVPLAYVVVRCARREVGLLKHIDALKSRSRIHATGVARRPHSEVVGRRERGTGGEGTRPRERTHGTAKSRLWKARSVSTVAAGP